MKKPAMQYPPIPKPGFVSLTLVEARHKAQLANRKAAELLCVGQLSPDDILEVFKYFNSQCVYCGCDGSTSFKNTKLNPVGIDHVVPMSRGGINKLENIVVCCRACNSSKLNRDVNRWLVTKRRSPFAFEERLLEWQSHVYRRELEMVNQPVNVTPFVAAATTARTTDASGAGRKYPVDAIAFNGEAHTRFVTFPTRPMWMLKETELWLNKLAA